MYRGLVSNRMTFVKDFKSVAYTNFAHRRFTLEDITRRVRASKLAQAGGGVNMHASLKKVGSENGVRGEKFVERRDFHQHILALAQTPAQARPHPRLVPRTEEHMSPEDLTFGQTGRPDGRHTPSTARCASGRAGRARGQVRRRAHALRAQLQPRPRHMSCTECGRHRVVSAERRPYRTPFLAGATSRPPAQPCSIFRRLPRRPAPPGPPPPPPPPTARRACVRTARARLSEGR